MAGRYTEAGQEVLGLEATELAASDTHQDMQNGTRTAQLASLAEQADIK